MSGDSFLPKSILRNDTNIEINSLSPTKNYMIDFERGIIVGFCDGVEALKQAIYVILNTERFEYLIYTWDYGIELKDMICEDRFILESELKRRIREALVQDDRVNNVDNFIFNYNQDSVLVEFTVFSIYGEIKFERQVTI